MPKEEGRDRGGKSREMRENFPFYATRDGALKISFAEFLSKPLFFRAHPPLAQAMLIAEMRLSNSTVEIA